MYNPYFLISIIIFIFTTIYLVSNIYLINKNFDINKLDFKDKVRDYNRILLNSIVGIGSAYLTFALAFATPDFGGGIRESPFTDITEVYMSKYGPDSGLKKSLKIHTKYTTYKYDSLISFVDTIISKGNYKKEDINLRFYPIRYNSTVSKAFGKELKNNYYTRFNNLVTKRRADGETVNYDLAKPESVGYSEFKDRSSIAIQVMNKEDEIPNKVVDISRYDFGGVCPPFCDDRIDDKPER